MRADFVQKYLLITMMDLSSPSAGKFNIRSSVVKYLKNVTGYDQEIPQSHTADQPTAS